MKCVKRLFTLLLMITIIAKMQGQNGINSPYTRFGLGQLSDQSVGVNKGMGGIGYGLSQHNTINMMNPASYYTVDTLSFLLDFGFSLQNGNFEENRVKINAHNSSIDYIAMQFRLIKDLGITVAFMPFSNVGYLFSTTQTIYDDQEGDITAYNSHSGTGGLREIKTGLGWKLNQYLSLGSNLSFLFGEFSHQVSSTFSESSIYSRKKTYGADIYTYKLEFGTQSSFNIGQDLLTVGLIYSPGHAIDNKEYIYDITYSSTETILGDTTLISNAFRLGNRFGAGLTYTHKSFTTGVDISFEMWSRALFFKENGKDCIKISIGGMYQPEADSKNPFRRSIYKAGFYYREPYAYVNGQKGPTEYCLSAGLTLPISNRYNNLSKVNLSGQFIHIHPSSKNMITENYVRLNLGLSLCERWFIKWQVE